VPESSGQPVATSTTSLRSSVSTGSCAFARSPLRRSVIEQRAFPRELAGPDYDADIPIVSEQRLPEQIREHDIDFVFLAYSDLSPSG
jgi:hypothetical protein